MQSRFRNLVKEAKRLALCTLTPRELIREFEFQSPYGRFGRSHRYYFEKRTGRFIMDPNTGEHMCAKRDRFDQIWDVFAYLIDLYIFRYKCEMCNHPRDECYYDWEGDSEYGYIRQLHCGKCGDSLANEHSCSRYEDNGMNHGPIPGAEEPAWVRHNRDDDPYVLGDYRDDPYGWDAI